MIDIQFENIQFENVQFDENEFELLHDLGFFILSPDTFVTICSRC